MIIITYDPYDGPSYSDARIEGVVDRWVNKYCEQPKHDFSVATSNFVIINQLLKRVYRTQLYIPYHDIRVNFVSDEGYQELVTPDDTGVPIPWFMDNLIPYAVRYGG